MTTDVFNERIKDSLCNLLGTVESFANEDVELNLAKEDLVSVLTGRWVLATMIGDQEYLNDHTWEDAESGRISRPA